MGGPATIAGVEPFLHNLFSDGDLIPIPFQSRLAKYIAKRRTPSIEEQYKEIGGGSPITMWTERQGELLAKILDRVSPETAPHKSYIAFRYTPPLTATTVAELQKDGVERAIAFTLYPQYSCSTTGSSLNELWRHLKDADPEKKIRWSVIDRWPTHDKLVEVFARHIETSLAEYSEADRKEVVLLFSAHSLPMSVVNRGDPYPAEVAATVHAIMNRLGHSNPYRLIWQSQVGPSAWLGPKTNEVIEGYARLGKKHLLAVPVAFVSDHIETLFEVDIEYGKLAKENGISLKRVASLNDDPLFIEALADLVVPHLKGVPAVTNQFKLRCPMCLNPKCEAQKKYFAGESL
ncbi:ferrochelatase hem15 [Borealophlyctis nickersoniae]|nr:ferrochelatase hem15 [Borealophlyctis nickersoniae]